MPKLLITDLAGIETAVEAKAGLSVMENIRDSDVGNIKALCGGQCACATCHVYVDPAFATLLPPVTDDEDAMLDGSAHWRTTSRLSCQIIFKPEFDGLRVTIAPG